MINAAKDCRECGWKPGTYLQIRRQQHGESYVIKLTAVGESTVLARRKGCAEGSYSEWWSVRLVKNYAGEKEGEK